MRNQLAFSYARPSHESAELVTAEVLINGSNVYGRPSEEISWDHSSNIEVKTKINVDLDRLLSESQLADSSVDAAERNVKVAAIIRWYASSTRQRDGSELRTLSNGSNYLSVELEGNLLGGTLELGIDIVLYSNPDPRPLSAVRKGTLLWSENLEPIVLEGRSARMPVREEDFTLNPDLPSEAPWFIDLDNSLDVSAEQGMLIRINTNDSNMKKMLDNPSTRQAGKIAENIAFDFECTCLIHAIRKLGAHTPAELEMLTEGCFGHFLSQKYENYFKNSRIIDGDILDNPGIVTAMVRTKLKSKKTQEK